MVLLVGGRRRFVPDTIGATFSTAKGLEWSNILDLRTHWLIYSAFALLREINREQLVPDIYIKTAM